MFKRLTGILCILMDIDFIISYIGEYSLCAA